MADSAKTIKDRMRELYLYDLYSLRPEIKILARVINPYETINCMATGVLDGQRRMLVVTDHRVIIIATHLGSAPDLFVIPRRDVASHSASKRFFASSIELTARNGARYELKNVSRRVLDLYEWALDQPLPKTDE